MTDEITVEMLREILDYNPETGKLYWRSRPREMFSQENVWKMWNVRFAGKPAIETDMNGYLSGDIFGRPFKAHRVIWALHYGAWPDGQIDHINGVKTDNRIENLRCVTSLENARNSKMSIANTSGTTGVYWHKRQQLWYVVIHHKGQWKFKGNFTSKPAAIAARKSAEIEYGYHPNHGRAA